MGRVTRASATATTSTGGVDLARLAYDKNSNPMSTTDEAGSTATYAYDAAGNRTSRTTDTPIAAPTTLDYTYDEAERMTEAGSTNLSYNKNGAMTAETAGTTTTDYLFDGSEVVQEQEGSANTFYARGLGDRVINRRAGESTLRYYHYDALGSVTRLSDGSGALTEGYAYAAFGSTRVRVGSDPQPYRYLGNAWDGGAGLYDSHAIMRQEPPRCRARNVREF